MLSNIEMCFINLKGIVNVILIDPELIDFFFNRGNCQSKHLKLEKRQYLLHYCLDKRLKLVPVWIVNVPLKIKGHATYFNYFNSYKY